MKVGCVCLSDALQEKYYCRLVARSQPFGYDQMYPAEQVSPHMDCSSVAPHGHTPCPPSRGFLGCFS
eukprot:1563497-Karenia_brevis.AAC.1